MSTKCSVRSTVAGAVRSSSKLRAIARASAASSSAAAACLVPGGGASSLDLCRQLVPGMNPSRPSWVSEASCVTTVSRGYVFEGGTSGMQSTSSGMT